MKKINTLLSILLIFINFKIGAQQNFQWAKQFGGAAYGNSIVADASGNVYTTGYFQGTVDFDPGALVYNLNAMGGGADYDIFVSKLDTTGNFVWAKQLGGGIQDYGYSIALDASNNVYTTGTFINAASDFDPGPGTYSLNSVGGNAIFVSKLNSLGNFVWAKSMCGASNDYASSIAIDASGNVCTTGYFGTVADFDPGVATYTLSSVGLSDIFISKLNSSGSFGWAKSFGDVGSDIGYSIVANAIGEIYTTGNFNGTVDFDPGVGTFTLASAGNSDIFESKLDASGNFVWAKSMGGSGADVGLSNAVDASGNIFITGHFNGTADFDPSPAIYNLISIGGTDDIFVMKLLNGNVGVLENFNETNNSVIIYPNPNKGSFKLQTTNKILNAELIIINSIGQNVHEQKIISGANEIETNGLSTGLYHYILFSDKQKVGYGKMVIE